MKTRTWISAVVVAGLGSFWLWTVHRNLSKPAIDPRATAIVGENRAASSQPSIDTRPLPRQMADRLLTLMRAESDPMKRRTAAQNGAQNIPRALLPAVLADLKNEPDHALALEAARAILLRWTWEEPTGAAAWTIQFADDDIRRDALAAVGAGWARQNPEALMQWSSTLAPSDRDWVLLHGASYLARTDLNLFAVWSKALPASREVDQLTAQTARDWAGRDPQAVANAIGEYSGPEYAAWRKSMAAGLASQLTQVDRCDTALAVLNALPAGPEKQQVTKGVVIGWSRSDPAPVAAWLDHVVDQPLRTEMSTLLAGSWLEKDTVAAETWAASLPAGPVADAVAERAAQYFAPRDRASAQRWAERIASDNVRQQTLAYVQNAAPLLPTP